MKKRFVAMLLIVLTICAQIPAMAYADGWVSVATFDQYKKAVEDSVTTHIRLTNNIAYNDKKISLNQAKPVLVIDGAGFTVTDSKKDDLSKALYLSKKGNLKNITILNMNIIGNNKHGFVAINDSSSLSDVIVTFDNVSYRGPRLSWGEKSCYVIRNSNITIAASGSTKAKGVLECLRVRFEGNVTMVMDAGCGDQDMITIHGSNCGVTIASKANVIVTNKTNDAKKGGSGFVDYKCNNLHFIFEDDSNFSYVGNNVFHEGGAIDNLSVGRLANVYITLYGNLSGSNGAFHCDGTMTVNEGSTFRVMALSNKEDQPLVQLRGKGVCKINSPKEFFIYNSSTNKCNTGLAMGPHGCDVTYYFNDVRQISYWKMNTAPYNKLPAPTHNWFNTNNSRFSATERISGSNCKSASATGYTGAEKFDTKTAALKDINVIGIYSGANVIIY